MLELINRYLHGYVSLPIIATLNKYKLFEVLKEEKPYHLEQLAGKLKANTGYLQIGLHLLESLDFVERKRENSDIYFRPKRIDEFESIINNFSHRFLSLYRVSLENFLISKEFANCINEANKNYHGISNSLYKDFLLGAVVSPLLVAIRQQTDTSSFQSIMPSLKPSLKKLISDFFVMQGWVEKQGKVLEFTELGQLIFDRSLNMAMAVSYRPMLAEMDEIIFGDPEKVFARNDQNHELHVERALNVIGSGFQHEKYFADLEEMIVAIFNNKDYTKQPHYIVDMGCGDGTLLIRLYEVIRDKTLRGQELLKHPVTLIGVDFNEAALIETQKTLTSFPHLLLTGDIADPQKLMEDLKSHKIDTDACLHIRSFLDHDRMFKPTKQIKAQKERERLSYAGVYVDKKGNMIPGAAIMQDLVAHLSLWSEIVNRHGMIILEVHNVEPAIKNKFIDQCESLYFDILQAFSHQLLIESSLFLVAAAEVGLFTKPSFTKRYPSILPYTRITANYFEKKGYSIRHAALADVPELLNLEKCWPKHLRVSKEILQTRINHYPEGQFVLTVKNKIIGVVYTQRIKHLEALDTANFTDALSLHAPDGDILQLITINIDPKMQDGGFGSQLLQFVLQWATFTNGIDKIAGVTRCLNYKKANKKISLEEYINQHIDSEHGVDPILRFHTSHGAVIKKILPHYRAEDTDNLGAGVLIEYAIRSQVSLQEHISHKTNNNAEKIVKEAVLSLLPEKHRNQFSLTLPLRELGFDSLSLLELRTVLEQRLQTKLDPTFFFRRGTTQDIIQYFSDITIEPVSNNPIHESKASEPIAIIGMACRFPGEANNLDDYWKLLAEGRDAISTLSADRKKLHGWGEGVSEYGGFLSDIDAFDPLFFNISPREAELMDPQQRILLQTTWEALENAGIAADKLSGTKTGVFVGHFTHDYETLLVKSLHKNEIDTYFGTGNSSSVAAGRISYVLGFQGPAIAVNTACSSSLVAVHLACQSLKQSESSLAVAAGVNLILSPELTIAFSKAGMLSPDGKCKTFDASANGYVRGEGCGVVILKRLSDAIKDHDNIYAVIKGLAVNQDGASNGLTAPNQQAQIDLMKEALQVANLSPDEVQYFEAHGTGTSLGDPVEVKAIEEVYKNRKNPLYLGSVKTNLGHLEAAAGIASLIKVVLSMQEKVIPKNLYFNELNPLIDLNRIKAVIPSKQIAWQDEKQRAAVSSFGSSGTNAHVVVESYTYATQAKYFKKPAYLLAFSAKTEIALRQKIINFEKWLKNYDETLSNQLLENISYTLNIGRSHFSCRSVIITDSITSLKTTLQDILSEKMSTHYLKTVNKENLKNKVTLLLAKLQQKIKDKEYNNILISIANHYLSGETIDFNLLHKHEERKRILLPTYPFEKERYWIGSSEKTQLSNLNFLHPMLDVNQSNFSGYTFKKTFAPSDFFLRDHIVQNQIFLPGVAYLELARAAGELIADKPVKVLKNVIWLRPFILETTNKDIYINIMPEGSQIRFQVYSKENESVITYCEGELSYDETISNTLTPNFEEIKKNAKVLKHNLIYKEFQKIGFNYGPSFQSIQTLYYQENEILAIVDLTSFPEKEMKGFILHPSLMDAVLGTSYIWNFFKNEVRTYIPFSMDQLIVNSPVAGKCLVHTKLYANNKDQVTTNITIYNEGYEILAEMNGFVSRELKNKDEDKELILFRPSWIKLDQSSELISLENCVAFVNEDIAPDILNKISRQFIFVKPGENYKKISDKEYCINPRSIEDYNTLFHDLNLGSKKINYILHLWNVYNKEDKTIELDKSLNLGLYSLVNLFKTLEKNAYEKVYILFAYRHINSEIIPQHESILGLSHAIKIEKPYWHFAITKLDYNEWESEIISAFTRLEKNNCLLSRHENSVTYVQKMQEINHSEIKEFSDKPLPLKKQGVYLLSGGMGGLGKIFARFLAENYQATLILFGRRVFDKEIQDEVKRLGNIGSKVLYMQIDISNLSEVNKGIQLVRKKFGSLNGIIHAAGLMSSTPFLQSDQKEFEKFLAPKLQGAVNLDLATQDTNLDFFVVFSSLSSELGDFGVGSYAVGNKFLDNFIELRVSQVKQGIRSGKSIAINWPYWSDGGMRLAKENLHIYRQYLGMDYLEPEKGVEVFKNILAMPYPQVFVAVGKRTKIDKLFGLNSETIVFNKNVTISQKIMPADSMSLQFETEQYLKEIFEKLTKIPINKINSQTVFEEYGIDSVMILEFNKRITQDFSNLRKTLLFEYSTIESLAGYLIEEQRAQLEKIIGSHNPIAENVNTINSLESFITPQANLFAKRDQDQINKQDIAIIGLHGRYPQANTLEEFWENLKAGKDCIEEIPAERWDYNEYYFPGKGQPGKTCSKWGGFIQDVDKFEPLFFSIAPSEVEFMDPQERLMLQTTWAAIEDAGYHPFSLQKSTQGKVGIFIGMMWNEYQLLRGNQGNYFGNSNNAPIANRLSYFFNFRSPSLVIDTACSSSLVAVHMACESILRGESEYAIAGGVNLSLHPSKYINMTQAGLLSTEGKCRSFGEGGDGYVPGEGVGAVLLKPLHQALKDRDNIYGVIKSSSVNHGGKVNGFMVPNPNAHADLISQAFKKGKIDPASISYMEAHGTGTALGDPIEITGLTKAYGKTEKQFCPIGSVKSNVGHLEGAAGIVALTKVLLQLKYKQLVPSIHSEILNSNITFEETPFYVQREMADWNPRQGFYRRAGISSFGAYGTNAHIIVEEAPSHTTQGYQQKPYYLFTLSAKTEKALKQRLMDLESWFYKQTDVSVQNISFTLNTSRSFFDWRAAVVACSVEEIKQILTNVKQNKFSENFIITAAKETYKGDVVYDEAHSVLMNELSSKKLEPQVYRAKLLSLADLFIKGYPIDWVRLHIDEEGRRISLPTYPFAGERYWIDRFQKQNYISNKLHPLLDENISTITEIAFSKKLNLSEFYLRDHLVRNYQVLPGVAYLEMAVAAGTFAAPDNKVVGLSQIVWLNPIILKDKEQTSFAKIYLYPSHKNVEFVVITEDNGEKELHAQGKLHFSSEKTVTTLQSLDIETIRSRCTKHVDSNSIYEIYNARGLQYGNDFRPIQDMWYGEDEVIAKLLLPSKTKDNWTLHPSLLDGALQSVIGFEIDNPKAELYLPFSLGQVDILHPMVDEVYVYAKRSNSKKSFAIQLADNMGNILVNLDHFVMRKVPENNQDKMFYYYPIWKSNEPVEKNITPGSMLLFSDVRSFADALIESFQKDLSEMPIKLLDKIDTNSFKDKEIPQYIIMYMKDTSTIDNTFYLVFEMTKNLLLSRLNKYVELIFIYDLEEQTLFAEALSGLLRSISQEHPMLKGKLLGVDSATHSSADKMKQAILEVISQNAVHFHYKDNKCLVKHFVNVFPSNGKSRKIFGHKKSYLISGGVGGLGLIIAEHLAQCYQARLILIGRSELNEEQKKKIEFLKSFGSEIIYLRGDVSKRNDLEIVLNEARKYFGPINGIIHSAGIIKDALIINKSREEIENVLVPKIQGTLLLDELTQSDPLDCFILFSSVASILGNTGQSDYAYANSFMDAFSEKREKLRNEGIRTGKTLSINWPLWKEGGMKVEKVAIEFMLERLGIEPILNKEGLNALNAALSLDSYQVIAVKGNQNKITQLLNNEKIQKQNIDNLTNSNIEDEVTHLFCEMLKIKKEEIDVDTQLEEYGLDSIMMINILGTIEKKYKITIPSNSLIDYPTLKKFAAFLNGMIPAEAKIPTKDSIQETRAELSQRQAYLTKRTSLVAKEETSNKIAIIAMAGRFPGSPNLESFWDNLKEGRDLLTDVPNDRWNIHEYFASEKMPGKSYSKQGGFIKDIEWFDAKFFGISDDDAVMMDPSQRILLEIAQELLDSAGYKKEELDAKKVGVFVGSTASHYHQYYRSHINEKWLKHFIINNIPNMQAARISDFYNFRGPAYTIDTACSSALVAVHQACQSILTGECEYGIAGGIELLIGPDHFVHFSQAQVLSEDGKCRVFDEKANGMVLGEGAGLVLLKEYNKALTDGDSILAVILGSAINNDGKTPGITVPNPKAQKEVIEEALNKSAIHPRTIGYYEAHGTGTLLGDPIEIKAMTEVYEGYQVGKDRCAIGSVKSNIGHLLRAAGVASLIKVVLAMQNKIIPPTIHCDNPHPRFNFEDSPFYPATKSIDWISNDITRRAAISSFGFGGTNCHMILEESQVQSSIRHSLPSTSMQRNYYWLNKNEKRVDPDLYIEKLIRKDIKTTNMTDQEKTYTRSLSKAIEHYLANKLRPMLSNGFDISSKENLMDMGVDSYNLVTLTKNIENEVGVELYPTLLFEYQNIEDLSLYFAEKYSSEFTRLLNVSEERDTIITPQFTSVKDVVSPASLNGIVNNEKVDIAIIGMSGIFPGSPNLKIFWENIVAKTDLIKEIPMNHWDYRPWFDTNPHAENKLYCKWGSFIDDIDKFDAGFFRVVPREAEMMDPQLRLLLQVLYATAEDAGVLNKLENSNTGIYIGSCFRDYQMALSDLGFVSTYDGTGNAPTMLANRPSFFFNLKGPSLAIDTACSSSLVALHIACQALMNRECEMAFVGGTNLILHSWHYRYFCSIGALSSTGRCHSFDSAADGYVPGEAVAAILLKPLKKAIADNNQIHAIIKGSAINHGGYTPSVTAPSVKQETDVILRAWKNANVDPATISYIEAHGTGTKLGDPIEIKAIQNAFAAYEIKDKFCAVGSVKSNIGHTEGSAGITGLIKTVLMMKNKLIPSMPNFNELNPFIDLSQGPIYINQEIEEWMPLNRMPRRAGISSFGFGGAYAHVVIEEPPQVQPQHFYKPYYLITISAKTKNALRKKAENLSLWLQHENAISLEDISYTSNIKDHFEFRCAMIVNSTEMLKKSIVDVLNNQKADNVFISEELPSGSHKPIFKELAKHLMGSIVNYKQLAREDYKDKLLAIANLYVEGYEIDMRLLHSDESNKIISMPSYPFEQQSYWFSERKINHNKQADVHFGYLHPMLDTNISCTDYLGFVKVLRKEEFYLKDHQIDNKFVLPGVAYLEMAYAAASIIARSLTIASFSNVVWLKPISLENNLNSEIRILLYPRDEEIDFEIRSIEQNDMILNAQGVINYRAENYCPQTKLNLEEVAFFCQDEINAESIYTAFDVIGLNYGPSFKVIKNIRKNKNNKALIKLNLQEKNVPDENHYFLHPSIMDGMFQSIAALEWTGEVKKKLPFSVGLVEIFDKIDLAQVYYVYVEKITENLVNATLVNESGLVFVMMQEICLREVVVNNNEQATVNLASKVMNFIPVWKKTSFVEVDESVIANGNYKKNILIVGPAETLSLETAIANSYNDAEIKIIRLKAEEKNDEPYFLNSIQNIAHLDEIYFLGGYVTDDEKGNNLQWEKTHHRGTLAFFHFIKALHKTSLIEKDIYLKVITQNVFPVFTNDVVIPHFGGLNGLVASFAKECINIKACCIDIDSAEFNEYEKITAALVRNVHYDKNTILLALRDGYFYQRQFYPIKNLTSFDTNFRKQGVYLIVGGASGVGYVFSEYLAKNYNATLIWIGRRSLSEVDNRIMKIGQLGGKVLYYQADICDFSRMKEVMHDIKLKQKSIHGAVHSALVLSDMLIENMDEQVFQSSFNPKSKGSIVLYEILKKEPLDFILFFSSIQAFLGNAGQSNYIAGCTFQDAFAYSIQSESLIVKSINWGYWGETGSVAAPHYQQKMQQLGVDSIKATEGLDTIKHFINTNSQQCLTIKATQEFLESIGCVYSNEIILSSSAKSNLKDIANSVNKKMGKLSLTEK